jgi:hypothetical protein
MGSAHNVLMPFLPTSLLAQLPPVVLLASPLGVPDQHGWHRTMPSLRLQTDHMLCYGPPRSIVRLVTGSEVRTKSNGEHEPTP